MKHLLPLILALSACASTDAPQKPQRGTIPDGWEDKAPIPPTNLDSVRQMCRHHQQTTSNVIRF